MSRPPLAKEKVLDAFENVLLVDGERAATMDRVAADAGVSKGGLLYHFASKIALEEGLIERMDRLVADDVEAMLAASEGPVVAFIRTSTFTGDDMDRAISAVGRLASYGSVAATDAIKRMRQLWSETLAPYVDSEVGLELILLVSDGIYFNNALTIGAIPEIKHMDALIDMVLTAAGTTTPPRTT